MADKKTHNDGQRDGADWGREAKEHWVRNSIDPTAPSKPHESGNDDYNKGVDKGVDDVGANRFFFPKK